MLLHEMRLRQRGRGERVDRGGDERSGPGQQLQADPVGQEHAQEERGQGEEPSGEVEPGEPLRPGQVVLQGMRQVSHSRQRPGPDPGPEGIEIASPIEVHARPEVEAPGPHLAEEQEEGLLVIVPRSQIEGTHGIEDQVRRRGPARSRGLQALEIGELLGGGHEVIAERRVHALPALLELMMEGRGIETGGEDERCALLGGQRPPDPPKAETKRQSDERGALSHRALA